MFFTFEILFDADLFVVFEVDAVMSAVSPFWLEITKGNAINEQDDNVALVVATVAAKVVVYGKKTHSNSGENFSFEHLHRKAQSQCIPNL